MAKCNQLTPLPFTGLTKTHQFCLKLYMCELYNKPAGSDISFQRNTLHFTVFCYRAVQFSVRVGDEADRPSCRRPVDRREAVVVDFSTDGGVVWNVLRALDPFTLSTAPQLVNLNLPTSAKTYGTVVRWWQPTLSSGSHVT